MRTLLVDNYDSYTFNLFHLLGEVNGAEPLVVRNDERSWEELEGWNVDNVVISPGPGRPEHARDVGVSLAILRHARVPVLGVCLGHQALAHVAGGRVEYAPEVVHGRLSRIHHDGGGLFAGIPQDFRAVRYHSLVVDAVPAELRVTARTPDGVIMGLEHRDRPLFGVQFHPESVLTEHGRRLAANFRDLTRRAGGRRAAGAAPSRRGGAPGRPDWAAAPTPGRSDAAGAPGRADAAPALGLPDQAVAPAIRVLHRRLDGAVDTEAAFAALYARRRHAVWLDSSRTGPGAGRFSYLGCPEGPLGQVVRYDVTAGRLVVDRPDGREERRESVLDYCARELHRLHADAPELPFAFTGGFAGYLGYELKAECGARAAHRSRHPDAALVLCDRLVVVDHLAGHTYLVALTQDGDASAERWLETTARRLAALPALTPALVARAASVPFTLRDDHDAYVAKIAEARRQIMEGETYEVCLTTELRSPAALDPLRAYRALRARNPAPYAALLRLGSLSVLSSSPERYLRVGRDRTIEAKPIKGTAPRAHDPEEDARLREELRTGEGYRAENLMIADLLRNDLGRVCALGSVHVPGLMVVESHATVHHLVSTVRGRLRDGVTALDAVRASFPGGSMTGAPKLRTMEVLDELEGRARGIYSGALGFLGVNGTADLSIVIRTLVATPGGVSIGSGGAILASSDPEAEVAEMLLKAQPLLDAVGGTLDIRPVAAAR